MDVIKVKGSYLVVVKRKNLIVNRLEGHNLVVDVGKAIIPARLKGTASAALSHMACGSSDTVAANTDTDLIGTEHERVAATVTATDNVLTLEATFGSGIASLVTIAEYGIFNDASAGTLFARFTTAEQQLDGTESDTFDVTWSLQFGE